MNFFSITRTKEGDYVGSEFDVIYIFSGVGEHKDEILDVIAKNKMCFKELDNYIKSLNGSIETVFLKDLVKNFVKRKLKNVEKSK